MFILNHKVLAENQVNDTAKSRLLWRLRYLSILICILKDRCAIPPFSHTQKIDNANTENVKEKPPNSTVYSVLRLIVMMISINFRTKQAGLAEGHSCFHARPERVHFN